jgi:protein-L-isoaspartate(D-aspartate) O-methyltransferase
MVNTSTAVSDPYRDARLRLAERVAESVAPRDPRVLEAIREVPRHEFVPRGERDVAYDDRALPIGDGQTISQPSMIAIMLDALDCPETGRALEIGAGCGYAAALLARLVRQVHAIEIRPALAARARETLTRLGIDNVTVHVGDGSRGLPAHAPFDVILVSAAPLTVPKALAQQLALGGRLAIPVGDERSQRLRVAERETDDHVEWRESVPCLFVPLVES